MKLTQRLVTYLSVFLAFVSCLWILLINPSFAYTYDSEVEITSEIPLNPVDQETYCSEVKITSEIPLNPCNKGDVKFFHDFAWKTFIALNWPANCSTGQALSDIKIGQKLDAPRVWEFYSHPEEVFLPNGADPRNDDSFNISPPQCRNTNQAKLLLNYLAQLPKLRLSEGVSKYNGEISILNAMIPLVDHKGNYIMNEERINPIEVNQILKNGWYDAKNLKKFNSSDNLFKWVCSKKKFKEYDSSGYCNEYDNEGAIEIKAAWMVAQDMDEKEREKYYITKRAIEVNTEDGNKVPKIVDVALVGFHLLRKTSYAGWIFATFEHIKNAPNNEDIEKKNNTDENYHLYDPNCEGEKCLENNRFTAQEPYLWGLKNQDKSLDNVTDNVTNTIYAMTNNMGQNEPQISSQITRENPINMYEEQSNEKWQESLKSMNVWPQFYQLIGVQWLGSPGALFTASDISESLNGEEHLANVALEPFNQKLSSCFKCHYNAKLPNSNAPADLSFLIGHAED